MPIDTELKRVLLDIARFQSSAFFPAAYHGGERCMFGPSVLNWLWGNWVPNDTTLYAFRFFHSSITLMATVCGFSPSQKTGSFLVGPGNHEEGTLLPHYAEWQSRVSSSIWRGSERIPRSLEAGLQLFFKKAGIAATLRGSRLKRGDLPALRGYRFGPCHTDSCLFAQD